MVGLVTMVDAKKCGHCQITALNAAAASQNHEVKIIENEPPGRGVNVFLIPAGTSVESLTPEQKKSSHTGWFRSIPDNCQCGVGVVGQIGSRGQELRQALVDEKSKKDSAVIKKQKNKQRRR